MVYVIAFGMLLLAIVATRLAYKCGFRKGQQSGLDAGYRMFGK